MRADDFLNEGGLRSWLWKLGKDTFDYAAGQAPKVKNFIDQPKGGSFGGRVPASPDEATHVYRNMNPDELEAARKSGYFEKNPNPGKTDWDTDKKYWSQGDTKGYFGRSWKDSPDNAQVRLPQEKLPRWTAGKTGDAEVLDKTTGTWNSVKENTDHDQSAVEELRAALLAKQDQLQSATDDQVYNIIDRIMTRIAKSHNISGKKLHDMWVRKYRQIPDTWIMQEDVVNRSDIELRHEPTSTGGVEIHAYRDGQEMGWVRFSKLKTGQVKAAMVHVPERLRRQGVASAMYRYARQELGLDIVPSDSQTEHGRAFWNKVHEDSEFVTERKKRRRRNKSVGGYWYPGYGYYGSGAYGGESGDSSGGDGGGGESVTEDVFNGIELSIETIKDDEYVDDDDYDNKILYVKATSGGRELGHVLFAFDGEYLLPQDLEVDERFQGQGIAATMYDYVKSKGYKIRRSGQQTDAGAGFWNKHRPEQNVWEGVNRSGVDLEVTELPDEDQILITATSHGKTLGRVYFDIFDSQLVAADAEVASEYRGQGIAAIIYDYAKELGWEVVRSGRQTDAGAGFWDKHRPKQDVWENTKSSDRVIFIGDDVAIVGQEHGKRLQLSDQDAERVRAIAQRHGAWYEGNGMDRKLTKGIIDDYQGSWDDDLLSSSIKGYPAPFLYVLFSNIKENDTVEGKIGFDPNSTIFDRILNTQPNTNYFPDRKFNSKTLQQFLQSVSEGSYNFVQMSQKPATESNVRQFFKLGEQLMWPDNWEQYPNRAGRVAKSVNDLRDKFLASRKQGVYVAGSDHLRAVQQFLDQNKQGVAENFADGKNPGRKGLAKRMGVNTKASVSDLRKTAKNSSGEKQRMAHWLANMKSGRNKNK